MLKALRNCIRPYLFDLPVPLPFFLSGGDVDANVEYSISLAASYMQTIAHAGVGIAGAALLEVGPGQNLGTALILAGRGARVTVADQSLPNGRARYYTSFYAKLSERVKDLPPLETLTQVQTPAEQLAGIDDRAFDIVLTHAVLEHVGDIVAVARSLARVAKPGCFQSHQIDMRDHRDFDRPLEFLLENDAAYQKKFVRRSGGRGNRARLSEWQAAFAAAGFDCETSINQEAEPSYLNAFLHRLRNSNSRYRDWPAADLSPISAAFRLRLSRPAHIYSPEQVS